MAWTKRRDIMLCLPMDDKKLARIFKDAKSVFVQPKLDGERAWTQEHTLVSSTGNTIFSVPHVEHAVHLLQEKLDFFTTLDGELYIKGKPFEYISSIVGRTTNLHPNYTEVSYYIFDIIMGEGQYSRIQKLYEIKALWEEIVKNSENLPYAQVLKFVPVHICFNTEEVWQAYERFIAEGYEGIIVRHSNAPYIVRDPAARPWFILKYKPKKEDEYIYVGQEEAIDASGKPLGRTGAIICADAEGNQFRVGPGIGQTHDVCAALWESREELARGVYTVKVQYQNLTATGGVPRFGKFIEIKIEENIKLGDDLKDFI